MLRKDGLQFKCQLFSKYSPSLRNNYSISHPTLLPSRTPQRPELQFAFTYLVFVSSTYFVNKCRDNVCVFSARTSTATRPLFLNSLTDYCCPSTRKLRINVLQPTSVDADNPPSRSSVVIVSDAGHQNQRRQHTDNESTEKRGLKHEVPSPWILSQYTIPPRLLHNSLTLNSLKNTTVLLSTEVLFPLSSLVHQDD